MNGPSCKTLVLPFLPQCYLVSPRACYDCETYHTRISSHKQRWCIVRFAVYIYVLILIYMHIHILKRHIDNETVSLKSDVHVNTRGRKAL